MRDVPARWRAAQSLAVISFVWPYINAQHFSPDATFEANFFLVFIAAGLVPEVLLEDTVTLFAMLAAATVAIVWGSMDSGLRVIIGTIPLFVLMGLYERFRRRGWELIPRPVAYRALQAFVGFSAAQYIDQNIVSIIPAWLTNALTVLIPRYTSTPYDEFGIRGVQGWASEPSGAAVMCFAFSVVALMQEPQKRWRVLLLFSLLALFNKSVYAVALLGMLGLGLLIEMKNRLLTLAALVPFAGALGFFVVHSARLADLRTSVLIFGINDASNREFARFAQMALPLASFPKIYTPPVLFGSITMEPLGLLPLLVGYGSIIGCLVYYRMVVNRMRLTGARSMTLAFAAALMISFLVPSDFVPAAVAFAYSTQRACADQTDAEIWQSTWFGRMSELVLQSAADRHRRWIADESAANGKSGVGLSESAG